MGRWSSLLIILLVSVGEGTTMEIKKLFLHLITEKDNQTACPVRVGGMLVLMVLIYYAVSGIVHKTGDNFGDVCKGFAWYVSAWAASIGGKSRLGGDATSPQGGQNAG